MPKPIWQAIHDSLKERIETGELPANALLPPEQEIADAWHVSRLTAHRALYELQRSGFVSRKRKVGTFVLPIRDKAPTTIGAVFFKASDYFQGQFLESIRGALADDYRLAYYDTAHSAKREASVIRRLGTESDAIVLFPTCDPDNDALLASVNASKPIVCIDRAPQGAFLDAVMTDNYGSTGIGLDLLASRGHRNVAHLTDFETHVSSTSERLRAYTDFVDRMGDDPRRLLRTFPYLASSTRQEYSQMLQFVRDALCGMLSQPNPPTAVFCLRDHYAAATEEACQMAGIRVPEDLEILAFVDRPTWMLRISDSVHRLVQDIDQIGRQASGRVTQRLADPSMAPERILVPANLVVGTTSVAP